jgi:Ni,Fe-hydrogenase I large subunit
MASVRSIDDALTITLNNNGRHLRNLIHGADTVMSHILHFYHLAAADFVNISPAGGILGSPWDDGIAGDGIEGAFGSCSSVGFLSLTQVVKFGSTTAPNRVTAELVESYVAALNVRKKAHSMGAIFSGRQPIQNAIVPGGVTTLFTRSDVTQFRGYLNEVRNFINKYYIPDVVYVASASQVPNESGSGYDDWTKYWFVGTDPGKSVSYGDYPNSNEPFSDAVYAGGMLLNRGTATYNGKGAPLLVVHSTLHRLQNM